MDQSELLAAAVIAIRDDDELRTAFLRILAIGASAQQVRVAKLRAALQTMNPPAEVLRFIELLANDQLAQEVYKQLNLDD